MKMCLDRYACLFWSSLLIGSSLAGTARAAAAQTLPYPPAPRGDVVDDYHGTQVPDPYRWLEDPDAPETRAWIDAENQLTERYLAAIPARQRIRDRLTALWNYPKYGAPFHKADRYFFLHDDCLQNQAVLYHQRPRSGDPAPLLDPNLLAADGAVALSTLAVSDDARLLAYATSTGGSEWGEFHGPGA